MRCLILFFVIIKFAGLLKAQGDSVLVTLDQPDGFYLTYDDFRHNRLVGKDQIITNINRDQLEFIGKTMNQNVMTFATAAGQQTVDPRTIWGFFQNKTLYVNFKSEFFRVPVFGSVCYLVATVTIVNGGFYDPMFGYGTTTTRTREIREFIINFYEGKMTEFTMERAEELLARDQALFAEYKTLSRRKRKEQVNRYIRKYNERHPVYFLK